MTTLIRLRNSCKCKNCAAYSNMLPVVFVYVPSDQQNNAVYLSEDELKKYAGSCPHHVDVKGAAEKTIDITKIEALGLNFLLDMPTDRDATVSKDESYALNYAVHDRVTILVKKYLPDLKIIDRDLDCYPCLLANTDQQPRILIFYRLLMAIYIKFSGSCTCVECYGRTITIVCAYLDKILRVDLTEIDMELLAVRTMDIPIPQIDACRLILLFTVLQARPRKKLYAENYHKARNYVMTTRLAFLRMSVMQIG